MAVKTDKYLQRACGERWRPRAEQCLGLVLLSQWASLKLNAIECSASDDVIDDGNIGQTPFTHNHFLAFRTFINSLDSLNQNSQAMAALRGLQIRSDAVIMPQLGVEQNITKLEDALKYIIRPLAMRVRAAMHEIEDDDPITSTLLSGLEATDIIDEQQSDGRVAAVGHVQALYTITQSIASPDLVDETLARAVDAACTSPLRCG